ncbi:MAG: ABC transporter permease [SAR324 cluster bacterium]|nr:ABC transporter permease [SAR324 cluster bacterium]
MLKIAKIAYRNLLRYSRRTWLTVILISIGMVAVLLYVSLADSFKQLMIGQITDAMLGHLQIHRTGYVASIDNSPLNLNLSPVEIQQVETLVKQYPETLSYSVRLKFSGMLSNFQETTGIRLNGINPQQELKTLPLMEYRVLDENHNKIAEPSLQPGEIWLPELLAKGLNVKRGDPVVIVATNKDGSVNGLNFTVSGVLGIVTGPGGKDGYMNMESARQLLRIDTTEANEISVRLSNLNLAESISRKLGLELSSLKNGAGQPLFEVHPWSKLTPFANIAKIIDVLTLFVKGILIAIVLVSIMNVMLMAVYERIREIGTIAAIGTSPGKIRALFLTEGFFLGVLGSVVGSLIAVGIIQLLRWNPISFQFGANPEPLTLLPTIPVQQLVVTFIIVVVVSTLASLQPAFKASRLEPIEALRHY